MLERGDAVPHFEVRTLEGELFRYSSIWQRKNLLLLTLPALDSDPARSYVAELSAGLRNPADRDLEYVVTLDAIAGVPHPGVLVADKWGEIVYAVGKSDVADLPSLQELLEWVDYLNAQCPECEGEAR
jgi:hypothetical protein